MAADLKIETVTEGNGAIASTGKRVSVHYKGMLSDPIETSSTNKLSIGLQMAGDGFL